MTLTPIRALRKSLFLHAMIASPGSQTIIGVGGLSHPSFDPSKEHFGLSRFQIHCKVLLDTAAARKK
jgi:hypothetical protein